MQCAGGRVCNAAALEEPMPKAAADSNEVNVFGR